MELEDCYTRYSASVYRICLSYTKTPEDARDLTHEVFLKIRNGLPRFRESCSPFTWIYRITAHVCIDFVRKHRFEAAFASFDETFHSNHDPAFVPDGSHRERINRLLHKTDKKTRMIAMLLYGEGLTQEEVSRVMNISRRSLNNRLAKLRLLAFSQKETECI